jgi:hypothetical protein
MGFVKTKKQKTAPALEPDPEGVPITISGACMAAIDYVVAQPWGTQRLVNWMALTDNRARRCGLAIDWRVIVGGRWALIEELQRVQDAITIP